jgi:hypothetical protein
MQRVYACALGLFAAAEPLATGTSQPVRRPSVEPPAVHARMADAVPYLTLQLVLMFRSHTQPHRDRNRQSFYKINHLDTQHAGHGAT